MYADQQATGETFMGMPRRELGRYRPMVSGARLGCMGMSDFLRNGGRRGIGIATIHRALDIGVTFLDTADAYGPATNQRLVGRAIRDRRDQVVLATKFGNVREPTARSSASTAAPNTCARRATRRCSGSAWM